MRTLILCLLVSPCLLPAQAPVIFNPLDAYIRGREEAARIKQSETEQRIQEEQLRQLQLQTQRMQLESERLRKAKEKAPAALSDAQMAQAALEVDSAFVELARMYPDFDSYLPRMERLTHHFVCGRSGSLTTKDYLEGLYVIAKFASFSQKKEPQIPVEVPKAESRP